MRLMALIFLAGFPLAWAKLPPFMSDGSKVEGNRLSTTCSGTGPAVDIARKVALNSCENSAADVLAKDVTFKSLIVQTEKDAALHSESSYSLTTKNLQCKPLAESIDDQDGFFSVYLKCEFDLSSIVTADAENARTPSSRMVSESKAVSISTVPQCDSILVLGEKSRVIKCDSNPVSLVINPRDRELIFRRNGNTPIHRQANDLISDQPITLVFKK